MIMNICNAGGITVLKKLALNENDTSKVDIDSVVKRLTLTREESD